MGSSKNYRIRQTLLLVIAVVLVAAGCGGRDLRPDEPGDAGARTDLEAGIEAGSSPGAELETPAAEIEPTVVSEPESEPVQDEAPNPACIPGDVEGNPIVQPDRRHEDIIFYLTGERQTGDLDPVEETIDDPNFGGVWGDRSGGIVVAVLDCSLVDADEIARIAGGPGYMHLIEVTHTFQEIEAFVDELASELRSLGIGASLPVDSTLTGRHITVVLPYPDMLPSDFGAGVPDHLFSIEEGELFVEQ